MNKITNCSYVAALFFRGFIGAMEGKLRECQEAGKGLVEEFGFTISVPYISKLSKQLEAEGVMIKHKEGKHYVVRAGDNYQAMMDFMDSHERWGNTDGKEEEYRLRSKVIDGGYFIRANREDRIPHKAFQVLYQAVQEGKIEMMFYPTDKKVGYVAKVEGKTKLIRPPYWSEVEKA